MEKIEIKKVGPMDLAQLKDIGKRTFFETFAAANTPENMTKYLEEGFSDEKLGAELRNENSELYFATVNEEVIGYLKLNYGPSQTEIKDDNALEIERIYVLKKYHGQKVGQVLYEKAISTAAEKNADYIWLGVWEENPKAISFYKKNGFVEFDKHIFRLGHDEQTDILMKVFLK